MNSMQTLTAAINYPLWAQTLQRSKYNSTAAVLRRTEWISEWVQPKADVTQRDEVFQQLNCSFYNKPIYVAEWNKQKPGFKHLWGKPTGGERFQLKVSPAIVFQPELVPVLILQPVLEVNTSLKAKHKVILKHHQPGLVHFNPTPVHLSRKSVRLVKCER